MIVRNFKEITTAGKVTEFPDNELVEFAFWGRSNVGKSSLINSILACGVVAKTSKNPGKTRRIYFFEIETKEFSFSLVDMPGFGYAKVSKDKRGVWEALIADYLLHRTQLTQLFLLVDSSIPPQKIDQEMIDRLTLSKIPFSIVFTKTDKATQKLVDTTIGSITKQNSGIKTYQTSVIKKSGFEEIRKVIEQELEELS